VYVAAEKVEDSFSEAQCMCVLMLEGAAETVSVCQG